MATLQVGWVQMDIQWEDAAANIERVERLLRGEAAIWVLPEMWSSGFSMAGEKAETEEGLSLQALRRWAEQHQALFIGSLRIQAGGGLYNRAYVVFPDGRWMHYDKRHLFRMAGEERVYSAGRTRLVVEWKGWRIAPLICYDLRFPVWSRRTPTYDYDLLLYLANWPRVRHAHWEALLTARAIENQAYVLGVNRIGYDGNGHAYSGGSMLIDYQGRTILHSGETEGSFVQEISREALQAYRLSFPTWRDADAFELMPTPLWP
ncbi:MAG: amidohydrolase [Bacteroidia bacterium]|nr:amidohydrolase [Bacteroidia bacterium]MDW8014945.1 amidohydrolase [Bacteroidia bacterium]